MKESLNYCISEFSHPKSIMYKSVLICFTLLSLLFSTPCKCQERNIVPDINKISDQNIWKIFNVSIELISVDGKKAVHLKAKGDSSDKIAGLAIANGIEFTTGNIELDLKGKNKRAGSFLGVVFNVANDKTFEGIYFRPFNFKADDPFRARAVQYISWPINTWEKLRQDMPGQFENRIVPVPDPDEWFHARIEVTEKKVRVFVNNANEACLTINRLAESYTKRPVGLFVDVAEGLYANLKITPDK